MRNNFVNWSLMIDPRATEIISFCCLALWAIIVALGDWTLTPAYKDMSQFASPFWWAFLATFIAVTQAFCLFRLSYVERAMASFLSTLFFSTVAGFTLFSAPELPTPYVYSVLGIANAWATAQLIH